MDTNEYFRIDLGRESRLELCIVRNPREAVQRPNGEDEDCYNNIHLLLDGKRVMDIDPSGDCLATSWWNISLPDERDCTAMNYTFTHEVQEILGEYKQRCVGSLIQAILDNEHELVQYLEME